MRQDTPHLKKHDSYKQEVSAKSFVILTMCGHGVKMNNVLSWN